MRVADLVPFYELVGTIQPPKALHAGDRLNLVTDVAPPIHLSTIFRYSNDPNDLGPSEDPVAEFNGKNFVYSHEFAPNATRFEAVCSTLFKGNAVSYATVSVGEGYHVTHEVISVISRFSGLEKLPLDCPAESLNAGDVILLETPGNPLGIAFNIVEGPLVLDIVMHSGSKYFGDHSDLLCGVLATKRDGWTKQLFEDRVALSNVLGNLEGWLGTRSLRTMGVRIQRASEDSAKLISWLHNGLNAPSPAAGSEEAIIQAVLQKIYHASLQNEDWLKKQMPNDFGPVFAIIFTTENFARALPSKLHYFQHATSLGGVKSLIEWRALSDSKVDRKLVRISVGLENWEDLKDDLLRAFASLAGTQ
ncbi:uncharacterized protein N7498_005566 [Penicillium cinerascens]|uniref:Uncharacterized protein n=1 Tax=Penicillium cinerascens TaxID=70096 RepID=A0A9W9MNQ2_9EURO|nr:uncharacterized protein N7498_005566 [Penicillium cinerascens]KAJ5204687.1 hypothetical protein N7498_005566 [Penicillium cinerascens]